MRITSGGVHIQYFTQINRKGMKTKPFDLSGDVRRLILYLMMIVVVAGFFLHQYWLILTVGLKQVRGPNG